MTDNDALRAKAHHITKTAAIIAIGEARRELEEAIYTALLAARAEGREEAAKECERLGYPHATLVARAIRALAPPVASEEPRRGG